MMDARQSVRQLGPVVIDIENITKDYVMGEEIVRALRGVSLQIRRNEYLAVMGPSGSAIGRSVSSFKRSTCSRARPVCAMSSCL